MAIEVRNVLIYLCADGGSISKDPSGSSKCLARRWVCTPCWSSSNINKVLDFADQQAAHPLSAVSLTKGNTSGH